MAWIDLIYAAGLIVAIAVAMTILVVWAGYADRTIVLLYISAGVLGFLIGRRDGHR